MELKFIPNSNIIQIDNAIIIFRNFGGEKSRFNKDGNRKFSVIIPNEDMANALRAKGVYVKTKEPREPGDSPLIYVDVKVNVGNYGGPAIRLQTGKRRVLLDPEVWGQLDRIRIQDVKMDVAMSREEWELRDGTRGRSLYLRSLLVYQELDRFADEEFEEEV